MICQPLSSTEGTRRPDAALTVPDQPAESAAESSMDRWKGVYPPDSRRALRVDVLARHDYRCAYCDFDFLAGLDALLSATFDHLKPRAAGGPTTVENLVPACSTCNQLKGARTGFGLDKLRKLIARQRALRLVELIERLASLQAPFPRTSDRGRLSAIMVNVAGLLRRRMGAVDAAMEMVDRFP